MRGTVFQAKIPVDEGTLTPMRARPNGPIRAEIGSWAAKKLTRFA
jgi:hypothetical protein